MKTTLRLLARLTAACFVVMFLAASSWDAQAFEPDDPDNPDDFIDPDDPSYPGDPGEPDDPGGPDDPGEPEHPGDPRDPSDPGEYYTTQAPSVGGNAGKLVIVDNAAIDSANESALPTINMYRSLMLGFSREAACEVNARLFRARSTTQADREAAAERAQQDLADRVSVYASGDHSTSDAQPKGAELGFESETWSAAGGMELALTANASVGLAVKVFWGNSDLDDNVASIETDGMVLLPYATVFKGAGYLDLLYGIGSFSSDIDRPVGPTVLSGEADALLHAVEINAGWNFGKNVVIGPIAGFEYRHLSLDGYRETATWGAVEYPDQTIESAISRLGAQVSWPTRLNGGRVVPQIRAAWEHEYIDDVQDISIRLLRSPVTITESGQCREGAPFVATAKSTEMEEDYLSAGAGVRAEWRRGVSILLDYEGHFFRGDSTTHSVAFTLQLDL